MKGFFRQSMAWLHTWVGLLPAWILYFVFLTGTAGYVNYEIDQWMQPELPAPQAVADPVTAARHAEQWLRETSPPGTSRWRIYLPSDRPNRVAYQLRVSHAGGGQFGKAILDASTGAVIEPRQTGGGQALYVMHYALHYLPTLAGWWIVGICTMLMLVALVTGIVVHKKIFKEFFTFRPGKGQRSWLDAHNVASVVSLPFQLMITYSGLVLFLFTYMPFVLMGVYGTGDEARKQFDREAYSELRSTASAGRPAPLVPLQDLVRQSLALWPPGQAPLVIDVRHPGDANARIFLRPRLSTTALRPQADALLFDGTTGTLLQRVAPERRPASVLRDTLFSLHEGVFAGPVVRSLYVLSGLLGSAMIATGAILWTVKRRPGNAPAARDVDLVSRLNIGTFVGLPIAITAYFWANRLLPVNLPDRADWEVHAMFLTWATLLVHAALRPPEWSWTEQLRLAAAAFALLPLLNALTTDRHLAQSLPVGDWVFAGFDLVMLGLGLLFAAAARQARVNAAASIALNVATSDVSAREPPLRCGTAARARTDRPRPGWRCSRP